MFRMEEYHDQKRNIYDTNSKIITVFFLLLKRLLIEIRKKLDKQLNKKAMKWFVKDVNQYKPLVTSTLLGSQQNLKKFLWYMVYFTMKL